MLDSQLDQVFRALADSTRRWIVACLLDPDASVRELAEHLAMSLPAVMQHLRLLEECGLLQTRKLGRVRTCRLESQGLRAAELWLRRALWAHHRDRLGSLPEDWRLR